MTLWELIDRHPFWVPFWAFLIVAVIAANAEAVVNSIFSRDPQAPDSSPSESSVSSERGLSPERSTPPSVVNKK